MPTAILLTASMLNLALSCAHQPPHPPPAMPPPPSSQATWHAFDRGSAANSVPDRDPIWRFDARLDEVREIAGEVASQACASALADDWERCVLDIAPGFTVSLTASAPPRVSLDLARLGAIYRASGALMLYRATDQASTVLDDTADWATDTRTCPQLGPTPPRWGFPVAPSTGGTFMRTVRVDANGQASPLWVFAALPEDACDLAGGAAVKRCEDAHAEGWTACTFPLANGFELVADVDFAPKLELGLRWAGQRFRSVPQIELWNEAGDRHQRRQLNADPVPAAAL